MSAVNHCRSAVVFASFVVAVGIAGMRVTSDVRKSEALGSRLVSLSGSVV